MDTQTGRKQKMDTQAAEEYGLDLSLICENLKLTPTERLEKLKRMVAFSEELKRAGKRKTAVRP